MDSSDRHGVEAPAQIRLLISRRMALMGLGASVLAPALGGCVSAPESSTAGAAVPGRAFDFEPLPSEVIDTHAVPHGYHAEVLIRWGDRLRAKGPAFTCC